MANQRSETRLGENSVRKREALCISQLSFVFLVAVPLYIMYSHSGSTALIRTGRTTVFTD